MSFSVKSTPQFDRSVKHIYKKYKSIKHDILSLIEELENSPESGTPLGNNLYKIRIAITGSGKGKSGGARVITYVKIIQETVILAEIYLKSEHDTVHEDMILKRLSDEGLL